MTLISWSRLCWWSSAFTCFTFMSRPIFLLISFLLVATSVLRCNQFPPSHLYSRSRPQGGVATSISSASALLQVATLMSGRDIISDPCFVNGRNFSSWQGLLFGSRLRPPFNLYSRFQLKSSCFYVATLEWCCDIICIQLVSRHQSDVAT